MKIDGAKDIVNLEKAYSGKRVKKNEQSKEAERVQQGGGQINAPGDMVNISSGAVQIQQLKSMIANVPDIREYQVNAIIEKVANGEYQINNDKVAHAIIREKILDHFL